MKKTAVYEILITLYTKYMIHNTHMMAIVRSDFIITK